MGGDLHLDPAPAPGGSRGKGELREVGRHAPPPFSVTTSTAVVTQAVANLRAASWAGEVWPMVPSPLYEDREGGPGEEVAGTCYVDDRAPGRRW